jgi:hypothetical protein
MGKWVNGTAATAQSSNGQWMPNNNEQHRDGSPPPGASITVASAGELLALSMSAQ